MLEEVIPIRIKMKLLRKDLRKIKLEKIMKKSSVKLSGKDSFLEKEIIIRRILISNTWRTKFLSKMLLKNSIMFHKLSIVMFLVKQESLQYNSN